MRASLYAHLTLEMLLDAHLMEVRPDAARDFAAAVAAVDPEILDREVSELAPHPVVGIAGMAGRFTDPAVLEGYLDDAEVTRRLDRMGRLVDQPPLPAGFNEFVAEARVLVRERGVALLTPGSITEKTPSAPSSSS
jgi:hypothetical protein